MGKGRKEIIEISDSLSLIAEVYSDGNEHVITIDGVEWVRTSNQMHATVLFQMIVDNIADYVNYESL